MNASVTQMMQNFSYDPFDPAVMADPPSYYRILRDEHPVYYIDKWDTYALSRFDDIWQVLGINDGTFVASEGTLPAATVLAGAQRRAGARSAAAPAAVPRELRRADLRQRPALHVRSVPAEVGRRAGRPDPRTGQRAPRRTAAARHLRPDPGLRRNRRRLGCLRISRFASRSGGRRVGDRQRREPGRARQRGRGGQRPARIPRIPGADHRAQARRRRRRIADCGREEQFNHRRQPHRLPASRRFGAVRHGGGRADARCLHRWHGDRAEDRGARPLGVGSPTRRRWPPCVPISPPTFPSHARR